MPRLQDQSHCKVSLYPILCHSKLSLILHLATFHQPANLNETFREIHPGKFTFGTQKLNFWKMIFLFKQVIFRFHVNLQGCRWTILFLFLFFGTRFFPRDLTGSHPTRSPFPCFAWLTYLSTVKAAGEVVLSPLLKASRSLAQVWSARVSCSS